jgi:hypothetical protein
MVSSILVEHIGLILVFDIQWQCIQEGALAAIKSTDWLRQCAGIEHLRRIIALHKEEAAQQISKYAIVLMDLVSLV